MGRRKGGGMEIICIECNKKFTPWRDDQGDLEEEMCRNCDLSYFEGQINDREKES